MSNKEEFDFFIDEMLDSAIKEFNETEQSRLLQEKLAQMDKDCDSILTADEKVFAVECFELILETCRQEERFVYNKGLRDGIELLKWSGVL